LLYSLYASKGKHLLPHIFTIILSFKVQFNNQMGNYFISKMSQYNNKDQKLSNCSLSFS